MDRDHTYDDIISLERPPSPGHPPMSRQSRAAQFSPFAALTGYEAAIEEAARWTEDKFGEDEDFQTQLNEKLVWLSDHAVEKPLIHIIFFQEDKQKSGGSYVDITERVKHVIEHSREIVLENGKTINFHDIFKLAILYREKDCIEKTNRK